MKQNKPSAKKTSHNIPLFSKENYLLMVAGLVVITIGLLLMAGGRSSNPEVFDEKAVYSFRRITLAPILIVGGLVIEVFAIMRKSKEKPGA